MKKIVCFLLVMSMVITLAACQSSNQAASSGVYEIYEGYVTVEGDQLVVDDFKFIDLADTYWIQSLGLTSEDMPDNYYIDNPSEELLFFTMDENTRYNFYDAGNLFVDIHDDKKYTTTDLAEFMKFLNPEGQQTPVRKPFEIQVLEGKVLCMTEILIS